MADIDNFFAKKDRKKSKGKKFTTSDNTGNPQEEPLKKIEKTKAHLNESDKAYLQVNYNSFVLTITLSL